MKIEDLAYLPSASIKTQNSQPGKGNFAECLKEALTLAPRAAPGLDPSAVLGAAGEAVSSPTDLLEGAFSRLENFARGLASQDTSLRQLSPLSAVLEQDSRQLQNLVQSLPKESPLRQVAEEAAALAWVESFKFQRGDYL
jgi:hypothetical protein